MKIILKKDVGGVGRAGEVKEVADGYAMNFLIGRGFAEQATPKKLAQHENHVAEISAARKAEDEKLGSRIKSLEGARITLVARATEKGGLFKSVGVKEIVSAIQDQKQISVPEDAVQLDGAIKETGEHTIKISAVGAEAKVTLEVKARA